MLHFPFPKQALMALAATAAFSLSSCGGDDEPGIAKIDVPSTYNFLRDGASTVSYPGQTSRLNQLGELKSYLVTADGGSEISAETLKAMFANTGGNGGGGFSQTYDKQLKDKTYAPDHAYFEGLMDAAAADSQLGAAGQTASDGQAGLVLRSNGNTVLVDANGNEYTQLIEKGLMGATLYYQICEVYLSDSKVGNGVENEQVEEGANYTAMEHHWDEAFGYFGVPIDFPANLEGRRFWGNYSNGRDPLLGSNKAIMDAFLAGRTAIVNKDYAQRDAQRDILYAELEKVVAATAVHYLNSALAATNDGDRLHVLSEAIAFTKALKYSGRRKISLEQIDTIVGTHIGTNLWQTTATGLNQAKNLLSSLYGFESIKNSL